MSQYIDYLKEVLRGVGPVVARRMFGGHGLFHQGRMFALVSDDVLYLKTDAGNRADFESRDLPPFVYHKQGKPVRLSYHQAPEEILDDPEAATAWARGAIEAAWRSR